jgi:1,4-alpha-glucan branching enzyme
VTTNTVHQIHDDDLHWFNEGTHVRIYRVLGAQTGVGGTRFSVWAPNARNVSVIGDFNSWTPDVDRLSPLGSSGVFTGFISGANVGHRYKFRIESQARDYVVEKADPLAFATELAPATASVICDLNYTWNDGSWMEGRANANSLQSPISVYEVHLGSWRKRAEEGGRFLTYRELGVELVAYVKESGFTHVEVLPIMEHPFYGSWGYQTTGYFAPTSRYGTPQDFMWLIDQFHQQGIGVILDWVPSHFPSDEFSLGYFDGTHLYEHADPRLGFHPDWNSFIFNYGRNEVRSFLLSSAMFWLDVYHVDGIRVDAVASMLYLDYSRKQGEWIPNPFGGNENLEAIGFLRQLNETVYRNYPDVQMIAEESTAWPQVSRPTYLGGLGFGAKWDMGWMHDTLAYFSTDPVYRRYHHGQLTFRMVYAYSENFMLPLSHDEVVYGKGSLLGKMPGDDWSKFANLRLLFAYLYTQPGKKLIFMGGEFGQWSEWNHDSALDWSLLDVDCHKRLRLLVGVLNSLYRLHPALHQNDVSPAGFEWMDCCNEEGNVVSYLRKGNRAEEMLLVVCHFGNSLQTNYRIGAPFKGRWKEILNTDAEQFGGGGNGNFGVASTVPLPMHNRMHSLTITLPPLSVLIFQHESASSETALNDAIQVSS